MIEWIHTWQVNVEFYKFARKFGWTSSFCYAIVKAIDSYLAYSLSPSHLLASEVALYHHVHSEMRKSQTIARVWAYKLIQENMMSDLKRGQPVMVSSKNMRIETNPLCSPCKIDFNTFAVISGYSDDRRTVSLKFRNGRIITRDIDPYVFQMQQKPDKRIFGEMSSVASDEERSVDLFNNLSPELATLNQNQGFNLQRTLLGPEKKQSKKSDDIGGVKQTLVFPGMPENLEPQDFDIFMDDNNTAKSSITDLS